MTRLRGSAGQPGMVSAKLSKVSLSTRIPPAAIVLSRVRVYFGGLPMRWPEVTVENKARIGPSVE